MGRWRWGDPGSVLGTIPLSAAERMGLYAHCDSAEEKAKKGAGEKFSQKFSIYTLP